MDFYKLWKFSAQIHTELVVGSRFKATGDNKEVILKRYGRDLSKLKSSARFNSIFISSILIIPAFVAVQSIGQSFNLLNNGQNLSQIFFANSVAVASYYLFNFIFMLIFGLMTIASLLDGNIFKFLHTLPFTKREIQLLGIMTFVRLLLYQIVIMLFVFPIGIGYLSGSLVVFSVCFLINLLNLIFICYLLINIIEKMTGLLLSKDQKIGLRAIFRYVFFVFYFIFAFSVYYFIGSIDVVLERLYVNNFLPASTYIIINYILPLIAFPFATGYLVSFITLPHLSNNLVLVNTAVGLFFMVLITLRVVIRGNNIMLNMAYKTEKFTADVHIESEIRVKVDKSIFSYLKMNLLMVLRDLSSMLSLTLAILFPILLNFGNNAQDPFTSFLIYSGFIIFFSSNALSIIEGSVGGLLSSLPIPQRQMVRGKSILIGLIYIIAFFLNLVIHSFSFLSIQSLTIIVCLALLLPNVFLISKALLFGRINGEYTLFDIEDTNNFLRNIILIIPLMVVVGIEFVLVYYAPLVNSLTGVQTVLIFPTFNVVLLLIVEVVVRGMFKNK